ncbi:thaumatin, partial [Cunninghamella echinulata]
NQVQIKVINQCSYDLTIAKLTNEQSKGEQATVKAGRQKVYPLPSNWQGRFFGRKTCSGVACTIAGASEAVPPASLAEFTFRGWGGIDYYDISLVDGFNLPLKITPINGSGSDASEKYKCGSPSCKSLPTCAKEFQVLKNGKFDSCLSACSKFNTDEYCCRGAFGTPDKCVANQYSKSVKAVCPDAYSFAYDDHSSTYSCVASGYAITFCP